MGKGTKATRVNTGKKTGKRIGKVKTGKQTHFGRPGVEATK